MSDFMKGVLGFMAMGTVVCIGKLCYIIGKNDAIHKIYENGMAVVEVDESSEKTES